MGNVVQQKGYRGSGGGAVGRRRVADHGVGGGSVFLNEGVERGWRWCARVRRTWRRGECPSCLGGTGRISKVQADCNALNESATFRVLQDRRFTRRRRPAGKQTGAEEEENTKG